MTDISATQLAARQVTSFCWDLSWAWPALASRCSPWPSTQSSGHGAPLPLPFSSRPQGLFHGSGASGLSSLPLQRESTGASQTLLVASGPAPSPFSLSPALLSVSPTDLVGPCARPLPFRISFACWGCFVGVSSGGAPWEPCSWRFGGQTESCFFLGQSDPAALNKTDPSRSRAFILFCFKVLVAQLCLTLCDPMDYNPPGSSVHGILQFRILEWVSMPSSGGSS